MTMIQQNKMMRVLESMTLKKNMDRSLTHALLLLQWKPLIVITKDKSLTHAYSHTELTSISHCLNHFLSKNNHKINLINNFENLYSCIQEFISRVLTKKYCIMFVWIKTRNKKNKNCLGSFQVLWNKNCNT